VVDQMQSLMDIASEITWLWNQMLLLFFIWAY